MSKPWDEMSEDECGALLEQTADTARKTIAEHYNTTEGCPDKYAVIVLVCAPTKAEGVVVVGQSYHGTTAVHEAMLNTALETLPKSTLLNALESLLSGDDCKDPKCPMHGKEGGGHSVH